LKRDKATSKLTHTHVIGEYLVRDILVLYLTKVCLMSTLWFQFIHEKNIIMIKLLLFVTYAHAQYVIHTAEVLRIAGGTVSWAVSMFIC